MAQITAPYSGMLPLGKFTIAAAGTTQLLTANCGSQNQSSLATQGVIPTKVYRYVQLQAPTSNTGNIFLLPKGNTAAANPGNILAIVPPGATVPIPPGTIARGSIALDSFCLDTDTSGSVCYGMAIVG